MMMCRQKAWVLTAFVARSGGAGRSGRTVRAGGRTGTASRGDRGRRGAGSGAARRSSRAHGHPGERAAVLHPPERAARRSGCRSGWRSMPARFRRSRTSAGLRTSSSTWRSTAPRTSSRESSSRSSSRSAPGSVRTSTRRRASTRRSTCSTCPPIATGTWTRACSRCAISPPAWSCCQRKSRRNAAWSSRSGAAASAPALAITDQQLPVLLQGSRYAERLPIGTPEVIKGAPRERLLAFYKKWYRPDAMAVIVVGDIDPAAAGEAGARALRGHPEARRNRWERGSDDSAAQGDAVQPGHRSGGTGLDRDGQRQERRAQADDGRRLPRGAGATAGGRDAEPAPARDRAAARCAVHRRRGGRRYPRSGRCSCSRSAPPFPRTALGAGPRGGDARSPPRPAVRLLGRRSSIAPGGRCWPPTSAPTTSAGPPRARAMPESTSVISSKASRSPVIELEYRIAATHLPTVTVAEKRRVARCLHHRREPRGARGRARKRAGRAPSVDALPTAIARASTATVEPWTDADGRPRPGGQAAGRRQGRRARGRFRSWASTVVTLSNGVEVWMKPTDFKNDQVLFSAYALGGSVPGA